jgi:transposase
VLVVLGYSRVLYVEFVTRQTALTVMLGLERAFAAFGGVPREILFDQMKSVIVADHRLTGGRLLENEEFGRFAAHWGFRIRACRPYRAQTKGKVERPVHYLRHNFLYGRTLLGDADLADQCTRWLSEVANARRHGTTRQVPLERWASEERAALLPLAGRPYRSLVLVPDPPLPKAHAERGVAPRVLVERRGLTSYAELAEAV